MLIIILINFIVVIIIIIIIILNITIIIIHTINSIFNFWRDIRVHIVWLFTSFSTDSDCCVLHPKCFGKLPKNSIPQTVKLHWQLRFF